MQSKKESNLSSVFFAALRLGEKNKKQSLAKAQSRKGKYARM
jgi:hypothetical protein